MIDDIVGSNDELVLKKKEEERCPECSTAIPSGGILCTECGYNLQTGATFQEHVREVNPTDDASVDTLESEIQRVETSAWVSLGIGGVFAVVTCAVPFINFIASYLRILIHECGHCLFGWALGFPSLPAFDFVHGGGVANYFNDHPKWYLILAMYAFFIWMLWLNRKSKLGIIVFSICLVVYAVTAHTGMNKFVISATGHGFELIVAGIFLYRAISGSLIHSAEQPVYALCGFYLIFSDLAFGWKLIFDRAFQVQYHHHPAGLINDFVKIARMLNCSLETIAWIFLILCLFPPLLAFCIHRYRKFI